MPWEYPSLAGKSAKADRVLEGLEFVGEECVDAGLLAVRAEKDWH